MTEGDKSQIESVCISEIQMFTCDKRVVFIGRMYIIDSNLVTQVTLVELTEK